MKASALTLVFVGTVSSFMIASSAVAQETGPAICQGQQLMDFGSPSPHVRAALGQCQDPDDPHDRAACAVLEALDHLADGNRRTAYETFRETLGLYRELDDVWGEWMIHVLIGASALDEGNRSLAESHFTQALAALKTLEGTKELPPRSYRSQVTVPDLLEVQPRQHRQETRDRHDERRPELAQRL